MTAIVPGGQLPKPRRTARNWALAVVAVLVAGGVFLAGWFLHSGVGTADPPPGDPAKGATLVYGEGGDIPEFKVSYGNCAASPLAKGRSVTSTSDCDEAHDFQVYGTHPVFNSSTEADWPDVAALSTFGEAWCGLVFNIGFLTEENKNTLTYVTLVPSQTLWDDTSSGSKEIVCVVQNRDGSQLRKSLVPDR